MLSVAPSGRGVNRGEASWQAVREKPARLPAEPGDPEHLPGVRDHEDRVADDLERRRAVQSGNDALELTMAVGQHQLARVRLGREALLALLTLIRPVALGEPVQAVLWADLDVDEERGTRGELLDPTA